VLFTTKRKAPSSRPWLAPSGLRTIWHDLADRQAARPFSTRFDSFEAWEKDNAAVAKNPTLAGSIDRAGFNDGDLLDSMDQAVFYFRESMSLRPMADISKMRYLDITAFKIRGGKGKDWEELVKLAKEGYGKGDPDAHWGTFELVYGGDNGTYLVLTARKSLSEVDHGFAIEKQINSAIGEANGKKNG
jgi:hypothetical protein